MTVASEEARTVTPKHSVSGVCHTGAFFFPFVHVPPQDLFGHQGVLFVGIETAKVFHCDRQLETFETGLTRLCRLCCRRGRRHVRVRAKRRPVEKEGEQL